MPSQGTANNEPTGSLNGRAGGQKEPNCTRVRAVELPRDCECCGRLPSSGWAVEEEVRKLFADGVGADGESAVVRRRVIFIERDER